MVLNKIYEKYKQLSDFIIYSVPPVTINNDVLYFIKKIVKLVDLHKKAMGLKNINKWEIPEELIPADARRYPSFVKMYALAYIKDKQRRLSKHFREFTLFKKSIHTKEYLNTITEDSLLTVDSICDIEIDTFKRINFDFSNVLFKKGRQKKKRKIFKVNENKTKELNFLKEKELVFLENYVEYHKNLDKFVKFNYEKLLPPAPVITQYNRDEFETINEVLRGEVRDVRAFDSREKKRELKLKFDYLKIKQERNLVSNYIRFKKFYQILLRCMVYGKYTKDIPNKKKLLETITIEANYNYKGLYDYEETVHQLSHMKNLDDGYTFKSIRFFNDHSDVFDKYFNFPEKHIKFYENKVNLGDSLKDLSYLKLNNTVNLYFLDLNIFNGIYGTQDLVRIIPNIKEFTKFYRFNNDFYKEIVSFNNMLSIEKKVLLDDIINELKNKKIKYTYLIPSTFKLQDIINMSSEEKLSLLEQLKYFKRERFFSREFGLNKSYYLFLKDFEMEYWGNLSNLSYAFRTYITTKNFILKCIKYVSLLNYIFLKRRYIKIYLEKFLVYKDYFKLNLIRNINCFFKDKFNIIIDIGIYITFLINIFINIKLFIIYSIYFLNSYIKVLVYKLSFLPRKLISFTIKSFFYIFILILQIFAPFSYIIIDFIISIVKKYFVTQRLLVIFFKFKEGFLTFIRPFKNQFEYNKTTKIAMSFKSFKDLKLSLLSRKEFVFNTIRQLFSVDNLVVTTTLKKLFEKEADTKNSKKLKEYKSYYKKYYSELNYNTGVSLTSDVQLFIETSSTKVKLGELYLPEIFPCLEIIKKKLVYEDLNYTEKFFYNLSRIWVYEYIYQIVTTSNNSNIFKYLKIFFSKIFLLFFRNRVELKEYGIEFFDYSLTNDSVIALQEYLILTTNYNNAKKTYLLFAKALKFSLGIRETFNELIEYLKVKVFFLLNFSQIQNIGI